LFFACHSMHGTTRGTLNVSHSLPLFSAKPDCDRSFRLGKFKRLRLRR
jgi:hypothetical protein